jgi:hypothetical protein
MTKESYSKLALNAMNRAYKKALEKAANVDLKIPDCKDGKIVFVKNRKTTIKEKRNEKIFGNYGSGSLCKYTFSWCSRQS